MRPRTLTRSALVLTIALALAGGVGTTAVGTDTPELEKISARIERGAEAPAPSQERLSATTDVTAEGFDYGVPGADWTTFRDVNLIRLDAGVEPVIRHGALDSQAGQWLGTQLNAYEPVLDPNVWSKLPAGAQGGVELMYWWTGTDLGQFLDLVKDELWYDGVDPRVTSSGIAVGRSAYGLIAYYIMIEYPSSAPGPGEIPFYRFYKPSTGTHFYSTSAAERNNVIGIEAYRYEGLVAYIMAPTAPSASLRDLNRFYLRSAGTHFYTSSPAELATVKTYPQYALEGVAGRVSAEPTAGLSAMHRFYRPASATHFYSANPAEVQAVKSIPGYTYEGVAFYLRVAG